MLEHIYFNFSTVNERKNFTEILIAVQFANLDHQWKLEIKKYDMPTVSVKRDLLFEKLGQKFSALKNMDDCFDLN